MRVIKHGRTSKDGRHVNLFSNFEQYGLSGRLSGMLRMDMHTAPLRPGLEEVGEGRRGRGLEEVGVWEEVVAWRRWVYGR